ncbi:DUF5565 family protein [Streptomyces silvisoli]|uniref:DUF5565 family protein n=1 Tax=Streptomyces silvisoli TaxID=3034235 RepID=A0ABT5ZDQ0_9ACTN|nr:DUF5565 family protein [Streptomyces silvisoli]MDF3287955.1 DUF5565 family protein [Streptomyces silvisoli]
MRKVPTLFVRDPRDRRVVLPEVTPGCGWVLAGAGTATRKWDGTCVMLDESGMWWARREVRAGRAAPENYLPVETDGTTGKTVGWEPMARSSFATFHAEAVRSGDGWTPGTYELVGPKINGNPDGFDTHALVRHGWAPAQVCADVEAAPRDFAGLRDWLLARPRYEGIVWHHPDGMRMAKIKRRDFRA